MPCLPCRGNVVAMYHLVGLEASGKPHDDPPFVISGMLPEGFEPGRICRCCGTLFFPPEGSQSEAPPADIELRGAPR